MNKKLEQAYIAYLRLTNADSMNHKWHSSPDHVWRTDTFTIDASEDFVAIHEQGRVVYVYDHSRIAISTVDSEDRRHLKYYELENVEFKETNRYRVWMKILSDSINEEHYSY